MQLIEKESWRRDALQELIMYFRNACKQKSIKLSDSNTAIQPVIIGDSKHTLQVSEQLLKQNILVPAIRPPTVPKNSARLRVSLCATHTQQHIDNLVVTLEQLLTF